MRFSRVSLSVIRTLLLMTAMLASASAFAPIAAGAEKGSLTIDNGFLRTHLPGLTNPRLMTNDDVRREYERSWYREYGWVFVATGDFNKDGNPDYAVVGKYDDGLSNEDAMFVAVFSKKHDRVVAKFVDTFSSDRAFLRVEPGKPFRLKGIGRKFDVVVVALSLGSDNTFGIAWNGHKYVVVAELVP